MYPCEVGYLIQVHWVISEIHGSFIKVLPLAALPPSSRQVNVPFLLAWLQHRRHHQVVPDQELGVNLVGGLVIVGDPPQGPYDRVARVQNLAGQLQNPGSH